MQSLGQASDPALESRILAGRARNEDACIVSVPGGMAIVQTVDLLTPVVNDPYAFGRIAACNALSDVYAMGGRPWCAMNIACFPQDWLEGDSFKVLTELLRGGQSALDEAQAVLAGGHSIDDQELKYGLAVTGIIDPQHIASNDKLVPGHILILTKALGTGILSTALKAGWPGSENSESVITATCGRLNRVAGEAIATFKIPAATDITGFGLAGHALEMATASHVSIRLELSKLPLLPKVLDFAGDGLIPAGCYRNRNFCACHVEKECDVDELLELLLFDPQTSGGLLLAVPEAMLDKVTSFLTSRGDLASVIGQVIPAQKHGPNLIVAG